MNETSELVESEAVEKGGRGRRVWGVVWKVVLVLVVGCGIWMYMVSLRPGVPERWRVTREPMLDGALGNWTGGILREPAKIHSLPDHSDPKFKEVMTEEVMGWLESEGPIGHIDFRQCDFTEVSAQEMGVFEALTSAYLFDCGLGDEQLAGLAQAPDMRMLYVNNRHRESSTSGVDLQTLPMDESLGKMSASFSPSGMKSVWGMKQLDTLWLSSVAIGDAGLEGIGGLKRLRDLELENCSIHGEGLKEIATMKKLSGLRLSSNPIDEASLRYLVGMKNLRSLGLNYTPVGDEGLEHVGKMTWLRTVRLEHTDVSDVGLAKLAGLSQMTQLDLASTKVTDVGLGHVGAMKGLTFLRLDATKVTDEGLAKLTGLSKLKILNLSITGITDGGLVHLAKLGSLESLYLRYTEVTLEGLKVLSGMGALKEVRMGRVFLNKHGEAIAAFKDETGINVVD